MLKLLHEKHGAMQWNNRWKLSCEWYEGWKMISIKTTGTMCLKIPVQHGMWFNLYAQTYSVMYLNLVIWEISIQQRALTFLTTPLPFPLPSEIPKCSILHAFNIPKSFYVFKNCGNLNMHGLILSRKYLYLQHYKAYSRHARHAGVIFCELILWLS